MTDENIEVKFKVELYKLDDAHHEVVPPNVQQQEYTISAGNDSTIVSVSPDFTISGDHHSATKTIPGGNSSVSFDVSVAVKYSSVGQKSVTLSGTITFNDNGTLSASKTIIFTIQDIVVRFSKGEVRPGATGAATAETVTATATRTGGGSSVTVNLASSNARASVSPISFTIPQGQNRSEQAVTVTGNTESVTDQDTQLEARVGGNLKGSIPITVTLPSSYSMPGNATSGQWTKSGTDTVVWSVIITIVVKDRWGKPLGRGWQGSHVQERVKNPGDAGYSDPAGLDTALLPQNWSPLGADGTVRDVTRGQIQFPLPADADAIVAGTKKFPADFPPIANPLTQTFSMKFLVGGSELQKVTTRTRTIRDNVETITNQ